MQLNLSCVKLHLTKFSERESESIILAYQIGFSNDLTVLEKLILHGGRGGGV